MLGVDVAWERTLAGVAVAHRNGHRRVRRCREREPGRGPEHAGERASLLRYAVSEWVSV